MGIIRQPQKSSVEFKKLNYNMVMIKKKSRIRIGKLIAKKYHPKKRVRIGKLVVVRKVDGSKS